MSKTDSPVRLKVSDLSFGEKLFLRRRRAAQTIRATAEQAGLKPHEYRKIEQDQATTIPKGLSKWATGLGRLSLPEQCVVLRRRAKQTADDVATAIGCSRYWLHKMETGDAPIDQLKAHWNLA